MTFTKTGCDVQTTYDSRWHGVFGEFQTTIIQQAPPASPIEPVGHYKLQFLLKSDHRILQSMVTARFGLHRLCRNALHVLSLAILHTLAIVRATPVISTVLVKEKLTIATSCNYP